LTAERLVVSMVAVTVEHLAASMAG